jgi:hypothetical protein
MSPLDRERALDRVFRRFAEVQAGEDRLAPLFALSLFVILTTLAKIDALLAALFLMLAVVVGRAHVGRKFMRTVTVRAVPRERPA